MWIRIPKGRWELLNQILTMLAKISVSCGSCKSMSVCPAPLSNIQCFQCLWLPVWLSPQNSQHRDQKVMSLPHLSTPVFLIYMCPLGADVILNRHCKQTWSMLGLKFLSQTIKQTTTKLDWILGCFSWLLTSTANWWTWPAWRIIKSKWTGYMGCTADTV